MRSITQLSIGVLVLFSLASCSSTDTNTDSNIDTNTEIQSIVSQIIGADGGTIESNDGSLTLVIPANALTDPTSISIQRFHSNVDDALFYELLPSGLEFMQPASMQLDVSEFVVAPDGIGILSTPVIVSTDRNESGIEILQNQQLTLDADSNTATLSADVSHFSRFMAAGDVASNARLEGVAQFAAANSPIGPVRLIVENVDDLINLESIAFRDKSIEPVFYIGGDNPVVLRPQSAENNRLVQEYPYQCGDPGIGTYRSSLLFDFRETESVSYYTPEEINIGAAFLFGRGIDVFSGGDREFFDEVFAELYIFHASRQVTCRGMEPVIDNDSLIDIDSGDEGDADTNSELDTGNSFGDVNPPMIDTNISSIELSHIIGTTECPTFFDPVTVHTEFENPLNITIEESLPFLEINTKSHQTTDGIFQFFPEFPCDGFNIGDNNGSMLLTARDPITGLESNQLQIDVVVTVTNR